MPLLLPGTNGLIAIKVSKLTGYPICYTQLMKYPDGEKYFRFATDVEGKDVVIFNSMYPNPDEIVFETMLIAETAREMGARSISCVFPYFAYSRIFERKIKGEAIPLKLLAKIFKSSNIEKIYTVDFHLPDKTEIFGIEFVNLTAMKLLANYCLKNFSKDFTVIAPDEHALFWAREFCRDLNTEILVLKKIRIDAENVIVVREPIKLKGDAVIVDDIISTGATVCQASKILKSSGCKRIFAVCTHAILAGDAMLRMLEAGVDDIVATDTIPSPVSHVSVAKLIAERLKLDFR